MKQIQCMDYAREESLKELKAKGYRWHTIIPVNKGRYSIIFSGFGNIGLMFKKAWFEKFGEMFKDKGERGIGDSVNAEHLKLFLKYNI